MEQFDPSNLLDTVKRALDPWSLDVLDLTLTSVSENWIFRVDTVKGKTFALRLHRPGYHSFSELLSEQQWIAALHEEGIKVPSYQLSGNLQAYTQVVINELNETRHVSLVEWLEGSTLSKVLDQENDIYAIEAYFNQLGQLAARIHNQACSWRHPPSFQRHALDTEGLVGDASFWYPFWDIPELNQVQRSQMQQIRESLHRKLSDMGKEPEHYSLIHADLHPGNVIVTKGGLVAIDFDDAGFGWHAYELAVALYNYWDKPFFEEARMGLIEGYRSHRKLSVEMVPQLPLFILIRALAIIGWISDRPELNRGDSLTTLIPRALDMAESMELC